MAGCEWCEGRGAAPSPTATAAAAQAKAEEAGGGTAHARSLSLPTAFRGGLDLAREREIDAHSQAERIASSWRRRPRVRQRARFAIDDEEEGPVATRHKHTRSEGAVLPPAAASAPLAPAPASATAAPPRTDSTDSIDAIGATAGADDTVASADGWRTVPGRKRYPWGLEL
ncbi:hypothetical protein Q8F55_006368 [Vanrija albida]|uniref:Uncharacterized protein n=1 Tax=Vanrija albida TaxID=181172 RepID=A0ABR3PWY0_9TREE